MAPRLPHLTWLRAFEAAARHLSFTAAAEELGLTQAGVSKQVKLLELFLGEPLFERRPRSLALTKAGAAYVPKVRDGFDRLVAGTEEVFGGRRSGPLTIRVSVAFSASWLAPRLAGFNRAHPDIPLRIVSSVWADRATGERFELDIQYGDGRWPGFTADRLTWDTIAPLCTPALQSGDRALIRPADLRDHRLLHVLGYQQGWADWLAHAGVTGVAAGSGDQFDQSILAYEVASTGAGVALGRSSLCRPYLDAGRLVRPFAEALPQLEAFYLVIPEGAQLSSGARLFRDWLLAEAESDPDNRANRALMVR